MKENNYGYKIIFSFLFELCDTYLNVNYTND